MKKVLTMIVVLFMVLSLSGIALAAGEQTINTASSPTVDVTYTSDTPAATFTVTIPASLKPNEQGAVIASGKWGESQELSVTTTRTVKLFLGGDENADYVEVPVSYTALSVKGNYNGAVVSDSSTVIVDPANSLNNDVIGFGTWIGKLVFDISMASTNQPGRNVMSYVDEIGLETAIAAGIKEFTTTGGEWTLSQTDPLVFNPDSKWTINGGDFSAPNSALQFNNVDVEIYGGTFDILMIRGEQDSTLTIYGGTFVNEDMFLYSDNAFTCLIMGGTFVCNPQDLVDEANGVIASIADGYTAVLGDDNMWRVQKSSSA